MTLESLIAVVLLTSVGSPPPIPPNDPSPVESAAKFNVPIQKPSVVRTKQAQRRPQAVQTSERITLDVKEADVHDVLRLIAKVARLNIIVSEEVHGTITMHLTRVTWVQALDAVLSASGLVATVDGALLSITSLERRRTRLQDLQR